MLYYIVCSLATFYYALNAFPEPRNRGSPRPDGSGFTAFLILSCLAPCRSLG